MQEARQLLQDTGVLKLPKTLLAWEESQNPDGVEPAMHLHRGLLPPNHERPERLAVIEARLTAAGLTGQEGLGLWVVLCGGLGTCRSNSDVVFANVTRA